MSTGERLAVQAERVTKDLVDEYRPIIHDILINDFYPYESISYGFGVTDDPEAQAQLNLLVDDVLLDGTSVVMRRTEDNRIIGMAINKIQEKGTPGEQSYFEKFTSKCITNKSARLLVEYMIDADAVVDLFDELQTDRLMEVMFLCVVSEARGLGAGKALVAESEQIAREMGLGGMSSLFTASASQAVGKSAGFKVFGIYQHNKLSVNGVPITERLRQDQQFGQICGKKLT